MGGRLHLVDAIRGLSILSMVAFHLCYDLKYIAGLPMAWFAPPLQDVWRWSIAWTFLFVAGMMCALSRDNLRRGLRYALVALVVFVATICARVDDPISYGIIFCMAASTLAEHTLERLGARPYGPVAALLLALAFVCTLGVPRGTVGVPPVLAEVPRGLYAHAGLAWLGFPGPGFVSGDYYPLIPHTFLFLSGAAVGWWRMDEGFPRAFQEVGCEPLELVGRHTLPVYVVHQPAILLALEVLGVV